jgi:two-component system response regulator RegA
VVEADCAIIADEDLAFARSVSSCMRRDVLVEVVGSAVRLLELAMTRNFASIVLEPNLPGRNWYSTLQAVGALRPRPQIVLTTSYFSQAMERFAVSLGMGPLLTKPLDAEAVSRLALGMVPADLQGRRARRTGPAESLSEIVWEHTNGVLASCEGNMSLAAKRLGIPRQTLYRRLRKYPSPADFDDRYTFLDRASGRF